MISLVLHVLTVGINLGVIWVSAMGEWDGRVHGQADKEADRRMDRQTSRHAGPSAG